MAKISCQHFGMRRSNQHFYQLLLVPRWSCSYSSSHYLLIDKPVYLEWRWAQTRNHKSQICLLSKLRWTRWVSFSPSSSFECVVILLWNSGWHIMENVISFQDANQLKLSLGQKQTWWHINFSIVCHPVGEEILCHLVGVPKWDLHAFNSHQ